MTAEWLSWSKALTTGNWGTSPTRQQAIEKGEPLRLSKRPLDSRNRTTGAFTNSESSRTLAEFAREHAAWFAMVQSATPAGSPRLHLHTEDLTGGVEALHAAMERVFRFLDLPRLGSQLRLPDRLVAETNAVQL